MTAGRPGAVRVRAPTPERMSSQELRDGLRDRAPSGQWLERLSILKSAAGLNARGKLDLLSRLTGRDIGAKEDAIFALLKDERPGVKCCDLADSVRAMKLDAGSAQDAAGKTLADLQRHRSKDWLTREEFGDFVDKLAVHIGTPRDSVVHMLAVSSLEGSVPDAAQFRDSVAFLQLVQEKGFGRAELYGGDLPIDAAILRQVFNAFDRDGNGRIDFKDLTCVLKKLSQPEPLSAQRSAAIDAMLDCDPSMPRSICINEFSRIMSHIKTLSCHRNIYNMAMELLDLQRATAAHEGNAGRSSSLGGGDRDEAEARRGDECMSERQGGLTALDRKLRFLFNLWDKDHDGRISFSELALGLLKFMPSVPGARRGSYAAIESLDFDGAELGADVLDDVSADAAEALLMFDKDADQTLDLGEFGDFMAQFCRRAGVEFGQVVEFLILLAAVEDDPSAEFAFLVAEERLNSALVRARRVHAGAASPAAVAHLAVQDAADDFRSHRQP